jgi:hypothetical protein
MSSRSSDRNGQVEHGKRAGQAEPGPIARVTVLRSDFSRQLGQ